MPTGFLFFKVTFLTVFEPIFSNVSPAPILVIHRNLVPIGTVSKKCRFFFSIAIQTPSVRQANSVWIPALSAESMGYRTFHVSPDKPEKALECLSDSKGMDCATCRLCAGLSKSRQPSIWINPHGAKKKRAIAAARDKSPYESNRD